MNLGPGRESFSMENRRPELGGALPEPGSEQKQRRLMLVALALLLVALIVVLIRDRQFWFPSGPTAESDSTDSDSEQAQPQTSSAPKTTGSVRTKAKQHAAPTVAAKTAAPTP